MAMRVEDYEPTPDEVLEGTLQAQQAMEDQEEAPDLIFPEHRRKPPIIDLEPEVEELNTVQSAPSFNFDTNFSWMKNEC